MNGKTNDVEPGDDAKEVDVNQAREYCQEARSALEDSQSKSNIAHNPDLYKGLHNQNVTSYSFPQSNDQDLQNIESSNRTAHVVAQQRYGASA